MKKNLDRQTMCNILSMIAKSRKFSQYASSRLKKMRITKPSKSTAVVEWRELIFKKKKKNVIKKNQKVDKLVLHLGI